ncbi:unnamed protein product [Protopolystoma xenopodis]|uniref:Uncharacterized protein n=1 Tax=Protopolystoma xenopodis TaxID=117903 RepID=A0A3S5ASF2_9PLAT|nr:unnamed protein product [Protopolystoma xenopodis]
MVKKKDKNKWRHCGDFIRLYGVTVPHGCLLPRVVEGAFFGLETPHKRFKYKCTRLSHNNRVISSEESVFGVDTWVFLEHFSDLYNKLPNQEKDLSIKNFPLTRTAKLLRNFLRMLNIYHRVIFNGTDVLNPLKEYPKAKKRHLPI